MRRHYRQEEESSIDMTPMLDIVFIMLIFFIVTTSFIKEAGVEVTRPGQGITTNESGGNIMVAITKEGDIWIDRQRVEVAAVRSKVERLLAENSEGSVVIQADKDAKTGILVRVIDQVRAAGIPYPSLAMEKE